MAKVELPELFDADARFELPDGGHIDVFLGADDEPEKHTEDASGHEHEPAGSATGGRFAAKGGDSAGPDQV